MLQDKNKFLDILKKYTLEVGLVTTKKIQKEEWHIHIDSMDLTMFSVTSMVRELEMEGFKCGMSFNQNSTHDLYFVLPKVI